ncbi:hypothetical protein [Brucella pseudogrignonensis]|uniref:hypothetical protein n=1 Tax=Brucella pseudogrignonensis TaxID=419475 RepID=UPI003ECE7B73
MAQHQIVRGISFEGITGIKRDTQSARDKAIANLPRLHLVVDPSRLAADGQGNEAMIAAPLGPVSVEVEPSALFDGRPVIKQNNAGDKIVINMEGLGKQSFSFVTEVVGDASIYTATAELFSLSSSGTDLIHSLRTAASSQSLRFYPDTASTSFNAIANSVFTPGVRHLLCLSWDKATNTSSIFIDNPAVAANTVVHSPAPSTPITAAMKYAIGNRVVGTSLGWRGLIGTSLIFDAPLHLPAYTWIRQQAFNALNMAG